MEKQEVTCRSRALDDSGGGGAPCLRHTTRRTAHRAHLPLNAVRAFHNGPTQTAHSCFSLPSVASTGVTVEKRANAAAAKRLVPAIICQTGCHEL